MNQELLLEERFGWLLSTLAKLGSISRLDDDDFAYVVFEELDPDVTSIFHENSVGEFVRRGWVSVAIGAQIVGVRELFLNLLSRHQSTDSIPAIREDSGWATLSHLCSRLVPVIGPNSMRSQS